MFRVESQWTHSIGIFTSLILVSELTNKCTYAQCNLFFCCCCFCYNLCYAPELNEEAAFHLFRDTMGLYYGKSQQCVIKVDWT